MKQFPTLTSRPAGEEDVPFLLSLRRQTMDRHLAASGADTSEAHHLERLRYHFDCAEILLAGDRPVGLLKVKRDPAEWEIIQIQLSPELQGRGLGRAILEDLIDQSASVGAGLRLSVLKANPARRLYEKLGFVTFGETAHELLMVRA